MYAVDISSIKDYNFQVKANNYAITIDAAGQGVSPLDALLAGLGTCVGVYVRKYLEGAKLSQIEFNIRVESELVKESPMRFKQIKVSIDLKTDKFDENRRKALFEFVKNCPAHNTLKNDPEIDFLIA
jgi:uncharacterized OsmC-like protein